MLTLQQVFDKAAVHLLTQNEKALDVDGETCVYRAHDGKMCAVGALIDDGAYTETLEARAATHHTVEAALCASGVPADDRDVSELLSYPQLVHDAYWPIDWPDRLRHAAMRHGLNTEAIDAL